MAQRSIRVAMAAGAVALMLVAGCGDVTPTTRIEDPESSTTDPIDATVTTTSESEVPEDTVPAAFGPSLRLPLVEGYGVLCSGETAADRSWYVALEGPFAAPELGEFEPLALTYERFLEDAGFEVTRPVDVVGAIQLVGVRDDAAASVNIGNTMHSNLVVAAWVADPAGFTSVAAAAAQDSRCYGVVEGMIASSQPAA